MAMSSAIHYPDVPPDSRSRSRDIRSWWERDPKGAILQRDCAPIGLRTPNGCLWGHQLDHIFWMPRIPKTNVVTVWSRSMLKAHGEPGYDDKLWDEPLVDPRVVRPWPVLKLIKDSGGASGDDGSTLNAIDRGCVHEHVYGDEYTEEAVPMHPAWLEFFNECPDDADQVCTGPILANIGPERVKNAQGEVYTYLWCEHFKAKINSIPDPQPMLDFATPFGQSENMRVVPDLVGLCVRVRKSKSGDAQGVSGGSAETSLLRQASADDASPIVTKDETQTGSDVAQTDIAEEDGKQSDAGRSKAKGKKAKLHRDRFDVSDLPKLEEFIPEEYFPDVLMVHHPHTTRIHGKDKAMLYKRYYPKFEVDEKRSERVAHLYISTKNKFGEGNHSSVFRAALTLPPPLSARSPTGQVTVAVKLAESRCTAHNLLYNEAKVYDNLPKNMQEEWCGYNVVPQCRYPVPVGPITPKFYGFYVPVDFVGNPIVQRHPRCSEDDPCSVNWLSPILLMEECGNPVEPSMFTIDQRTECFSLLLRLHHNDILQGSFYVRNIMIQPGPLSRSPEERSMDTPSFRIIDFGRGRFWDWELQESGDAEKKRHEFARTMGDEVNRARRQLLVDTLAF